ncbi:MAG: hypothetical protein JWR19_3863 [Pedosphaera sp.]|nr:hypothetical protein [Pedosphaera sp.]
MQNTETCVVGQPGPLVEIQCEPLTEFDRTDLESVRRAFAPAVACSFQQAWLPETEADFSPGEVRLGWRGNSLLVFAELTDLDIHNPAIGLNQRAWELGDVFEMFFKPTAAERYVEFQVTPQNQRLQLSHVHARHAEWASYREAFAKSMLWDEAFHSQTWVEAEANRWLVYAEIPARTIGDARLSLVNSRWCFSFGRYDYTRGFTEPVISSTSPHTKLDFHRQHEWGTMTFKNSLAIVN